jgi:hypothetical protein
VEGSFQAHGWGWADGKVGTNGPEMTPSQRADFFLSLPPGAETWDRIEQCDDDTVSLYWIQFFPRVEDPADCLRAAEQLLVHGRAWQALDLLALYLEQVAPSAGIVLKVLEAAIYTPPGDFMNQSLLYEISQIFNYLEPAEGVDEGRLAQVEWALLPLFKFEQRPLKILHRQLATNAAFFVEIVSTAYRGTDEEPKELGEQDRASARAAYYLLRSASIVPGTRDDGTIDPAKLSEWVSEARELLEERKRLEIGDQCIGRILHQAKQDDDGLWPSKVIRDQIEKLRSDDIELGLEIAERNARGVSSRNPTEGREQERQIMERYLAQARRIRLTWPRTAAMLRRIAQAYESEAYLNDRDAELRENGC